MKAEVLIIPGMDVVEAVKRSLSGWLGPAVEYCNHIPIIDATLGHLLHGPVLSGDRAAPDIIQGYGIPYEAAEKLSQDLENLIEAFIYQFLGEEMHDHDYDWDIRPNGDIYLTVMPGGHGVKLGNENAWINGIKEGISRGDWYPESVRRLVGC